MQVSRVSSNYPRLGWARRRCNRSQASLRLWHRKHQVLILGGNMTYVSSTGQTVSHRDNMRCCLAIKQLLIPTFAAQPRDTASWCTPLPCEPQGGSIISAQHREPPLRKSNHSPSLSDMFLAVLLPISRSLSLHFMCASFMRPRTICAAPVCTGPTVPTTQGC